MNRLATDKRTAVIAAVVEGMSINATCRMTGVAKHTLLKLLKDLGCAAASYHDQHVRNLRVRRVQPDEIWAFVYGKDKNLTMEQVKAGAGGVWTWTAIDADTKLIISYTLGIAARPRRKRLCRTRRFTRRTKCIQQKIGEPRPRRCAVLHALQLLSRS